ncbi:MAG: LamG domain-containing protein, partial [Candidatus Omnitrophica bacterium]|nr:LamG domain-containing protein [Candidatus Omnitrophota bacterium]
IQSGSETFASLGINGTGTWTLYDDVEATALSLSNGTLTHHTDLAITEIKAATTVGGGTFTGVESSIAHVGDLTLTSGVFNAPNKNLILTGNFSSAATTFEAGNGTVVFVASDTNNTITTNSETFYNFTLGDGLIGYWKLDETDEGDCAGDGSNYDACDSSGFGSHGEWFEFPTASTDSPKPFRFANSRSLLFDGTDDGVELYSPSILDDVNTFTYSAWAKVTDTDGNSPIIEKGNGSSRRKYLVYGATTGGSPRVISAYVDCTTTDASSSSVTNTYSVNRWDHVVATYDDKGDRTPRIYINGSEVTYDSQTACVGNVVSEAANNMRIALTPGTGFYEFAGRIDDVRIYNRVLSLDEINALAKAEVHWDNDNTYTLQDALDVDENVLLSSGTLVTGGQDINVGGSWANYNDATYTGSTSSVTFDAIDAGHTIKTNNQTFHNIVFDDGGVDGGGWSVTLDALETGNLFTVTASDSVDGVDLDGFDLTVGGDFIIDTNGEVTASNSSIKVSGDWYLTGGTFNRGTSTVLLIGTGVYYDDNSNVLYDLKVAFPGQTTTLNTHSFSYNQATLSGGTLSDSGSFSFYVDRTNDYSDPLAIVLGSTINTPIIFAGSTATTATVNVPGYSGYNNLNFEHNGAGVLTYQLQGDITVAQLGVTGFTDGGNNVLEAAGYNITSLSNLRIGNSGSTARYSQLNLGASTLDVGSDITIYLSDASGTNALVATTGSINIGGDWTNSDTFTSGTGTVVFDSTSGDQNITTGGMTFYDLVINNTDAASATDDVILLDDLEVDNNVTIADGDFQGGSYDLNVAGTWSMATAGTFTAGTSSVFFDDSSKVTTLSGNTAFYNLVIIIPSKQVDFTAGTTTTVSNAFTVDGQALATFIDLNSTVAGTQWTINTPTTTEDVEFADIQDSVSLFDSLTARNSVDRGNNIFWLFGLYSTTGFNDFADGAWTSNATWNKPAGSVMGVNYPGPSDRVTVDSHAVTMSADAYAGGIVVNDDVGGASVDLTDGGYDLNIYGNIDVEDALNIVTSTGRWIQLNDGTASNPNASNAFNTYEVGAGISASTSGNLRIAEDLVLGNSASLALTGGYAVIFPTTNDFVTMGTGASITSGTLFLRPTGDVTQGTLSIPNVIVRLSNVNNASITMTGNWSVDDLRIYGDTSSDTEAEAMTLNTDTYNLTTTGYLSLGDTAAAAYYGKIDFGSGNHTIGEYINVEGTTDTWGYFDLDNAQISVGGNIDFERATVVPGSSSVTMNDTAGTSTITSWGQTFNDLIIDDAGGTATIQPVDDMDINGGFIMTDGIFDLATNDPDMYIAHAVTFNGGTFIKGIGTVNFDGDLTYNDNVGGVDIGNLVIGGSPETTDLATDLTATVLTINYSDTLNTNGYDLDIGSFIDINGTLDATDDVAGDRTLVAAGASWDMTGGTFTIDNSSVTFDSVVTGNTIISDGKSFYDLVVNDGGGDSGGWALADGLITTNSFTVTATDTNGAGVDLAGYDLTVGADFVMASSGELTASTSTINVSGSWNTAAGTFNEDASSVKFLGLSKDIRLGGTSGNGDFKKLVIQGTYTLQNSGFFIGSDSSGDDAVLTIDDGATLSFASGSVGSLNTNVPFIIGTGSTLGGSGTLSYYTSSAVDITTRFLNNGTIGISNFRYETADGSTNVLPAFAYGGNLVIYNVDGGSGVAVLGPGTLTVSGNLSVETDAPGVQTLDNRVNDSPIYVAGDYTLENSGAGLGVLLVDASTVTFNGASTQTITTNTGTFFDVVITNSSDYVTFDDSFETTNLTVNTPGASLKFSDGLIYTVSGSLNINGQYQGGEIYIESTPGAVEFTFDVPGAVQNIYYVSVQDSHASSNDIYAWGAVNKGGTDSGDATPHWIFDALFPVSRAIFTGGSDDGYDMGEYTLEGGKGIWFGINF